MNGRATATPQAVRCVRRALVVAVLALVVAACGIEPQAEPRDIPAEQRADFEILVTGDEAAGTSRIYLVAPADPDEPQRLRSVLRDVPGDPDSLLASLFSGPNAEEQEVGLTTVLPRELELIGRTRTTGGVLTVDVSNSLETLTPDALRIAVAQIVTTATGIDGIEAVRLRVAGEDQPWPVGDGELTDVGDTLTVYDYPGLVESTQPALPALPGGEA